MHASSSCRGCDAASRDSHACTWTPALAGRGWQLEPRHGACGDFGSAGIRHTPASTGEALFGTEHIGPATLVLRAGRVVPPTYTALRINNYRPAHVAHNLIAIRRFFAVLHARVLVCAGSAGQNFRAWGLSGVCSLASRGTIWVCVPLAFYDVATP